MADELVTAVRRLRKVLGQSQQRFATDLGLSIRTIANYEAGRRPSGKPLLALANAATRAGQADLANRFLDALSGELDSWPFQILIVPATQTRAAHGHLLLKLDGSVQLRGAQSFRDLTVAVDSPDPEIKKTAIAALESLRKAASICNENPLVSQIQDAVIGSSIKEKK